MCVDEFVPTEQPASWRWFVSNSKSVFAFPEISSVIFCGDSGLSSFKANISQTSDGLNCTGYAVNFVGFQDDRKESYHAFPFQDPQDSEKYYLANCTESGLSVFQMKTSDGSPDMSHVYEVDPKLGVALMSAVQYDGSGNPYLVGPEDREIVSRMYKTQQEYEVFDQLSDTEDPSSESYIKKEEQPEIISSFLCAQFDSDRG